MLGFRSVLFYTAMALQLLLIIDFPLSAAPRDRYAVIISIDGWANFHAEEKTAHTPNINSIIRNGFRGYGKTVFPSMTWPTHTSMVTGARPVKHGVLGNMYLDRQNRKVLKAWEENGEKSIRVKALYDIFKKHGMKTAALIWPMSREVRNIDFNIPELYDEDHFRKFVDRSFQDELRAAGIPVDLLNQYSVREEIPLDALTRDIAVYLIRKHRPNLLLVHFNTLDTWEHYNDPRAAQSRWALEVIDLYIGDIIRALQQAGIFKKTAIFLIADHGFLKVNTRIDLNQALYLDGIVRTPLNPDLREEQVWAVHNGHMAHVYILNNNSEMLLNRVSSVMKKIPGVEKIFLPGDYSKLGLPLPEKNQFSGDLVVLSRPDSFFDSNPIGVISVKSEKYKGMHGYLPEKKDMYISSAASGFGIKKLKTPVEFNLIDLAPTVLKLFKLEIPASMEGRAVKKVLK